MLVTNWSFHWLTDEIDVISVFLDSYHTVEFFLEVSWCLLFIERIAIFNYLEIW